jgi:hypothetical protein
VQSRVDVRAFIDDALHGVGVHVDQDRAAMHGERVVVVCGYARVV